MTDEAEIEMLLNRIIEQIRVGNNSIALRLVNRLREVNAFLYRANLAKANLHSADFSGMNLISANFREADLRMANFNRSILLGANLELADLRDASIQGAKLALSSLQMANLQGANLQDTTLYRAQLCGAKLTQAIFNTDTILPDNSNWSPDRDLECFTNLKHPRYYTVTNSEAYDKVANSHLENQYDSD